MYHLWVVGPQLKAVAGFLAVVLAAGGTCSRRPYMIPVCRPDPVPGLQARALITKQPAGRGQRATNNETKMPKYDDVFFARGEAAYPTDAGQRSSPKRVPITDVVFQASVLE